MPTLALPNDVESVFQEFFTCDVTTVTRQGQPITWPLMAFYYRPQGQFIFTSSIAFAVKASNARRNPKVSLLFSDPTGTQLTDPPAVLVQGDATVAEVDQWEPWMGELYKTSLSRQPASRQYISNAFVRQLFLFYFQRLAITVKPRRILAWPHRDFSAPPREIEVAYVE